MVRSREEAAKRAEASRTNTPGSCQKWTRTLFDAPSAGDQDHDGDADAVDGWKSEPRAARHVDRNPPRGVPVAWSGGSHGYGHRAISLGGGKIRSTDAGGSGRVATVDLDWPEKHWGLRWLGWSDTIDGQAIPDGKPTPSKPAKTTFGIDGSHYQFGNGLSLKAAKKQGYDFVLLKCTQGSHYVDPTYKAALADAKANGYLTAAYHFLEQGDADGQAANLAAHIVDKSVPVAIDVEPDKSSRPTASDWVAFRNACTKRGLKVTLKYLTESYWGEIGKPNLAGPLALWRAAYPSSKRDYGSRLYPGNKHSRWRSFGGQTPTLWQFASTGKIDGYSGNVDVNAFRGTRAELAALGLFKDYAAEKPPPPPPPPPPPVEGSTTLTLVGEPEVLEKRSSDHQAVVWTVQLSSGETVRMGQANLQGTDAIGTTRQYVDWLLPQADAWVFNEVTSFALQKYVYNVSTPRPDGTTLGWGRYMHGFGVDAKKRVDSAAVALLWNTDVLQRVATSFEVLSRGIFSIEPTRVLPRVLLQVVGTGERFWRQGSHTEQHVDVGGRARVKGAITGQNTRAKHSFAAIAADTVQATGHVIDGKTAPLFGSGDLNVDYDDDRREVLKDGGTSWFPYTVLGQVSKIRALNAHGPTHGGRLIDWGWMRQAH